LGPKDLVDRLLRNRRHVRRSRDLHTRDDRRSARTPAVARRSRTDSRFEEIPTRDNLDRAARRRLAILLFLESVGVYSARATIGALQSFLEQFRDPE